MRSRRPAVRVHPTPPIGPTDRPKDSNQRVRLTESQTGRETPHRSSLAYRRCRGCSGFGGPARESGPFSWRGDQTQAGSDVEDYDPLGGPADRLGDRAVIRVVEIGVTRLRRGESDDEAVVVAVLQPFGAGGVPLDHGEHARDCADNAKAAEQTKTSRPTNSISTCP
jgi:hypothetical protein